MKIAFCESTACLVSGIYRHGNAAVFLCARRAHVLTGESPLTCSTERSVGEIIAYLLLDLAWKQKSFIFLGILAIFFWRDSKRSGKGFDKMCIISET